MPFQVQHHSLREYRGRCRSHGQHGNQDSDGRAADFDEGQRTFREVADALRQAVGALSNEASAHVDLDHFAKLVTWLEEANSATCRQYMELVGCRWQYSMIPLLKQVLLGLEVRSAANLYGHIQKVVATALPRVWAETMRSLVSAASMPSRTVLYDYRLSLHVGYLLLLREQLKTDVLAKKEFVAQIGLDSSP